MKNFISGIDAGALMLVVGMLIGRVFQFVFPSIKTEYENPGLFGPWSDPLMSLMFIEPFITAVVLAFIWDMLKGVMQGSSSISKELYFSIVYWVKQFQE